MFVDAVGVRRAGMEVDAVVSFHGVLQVSSNRHDRPCARLTVHGPSTLGVTGRNRH